MMLIDIEVHLKPIHHAEPPLILLKIDEIVLFDGGLIQDEVFKYHNDLCNGVHSISLEFLNKKDSDCIGGKDKAVIVDKVLFFGIDSKHVLYNSTYIPRYSEQYIESSDNLDSELSSCNYLGWNGVWKLQFNTPVFTWLHNIENLGWIYPMSKKI